ncbi:DUF502 domain-containing protein [Deferribacterales bacterium Es71-Z0220]|jgi:uncharacterized membrane protein|uniref:DUF502 domain-containing protein n=1 Tax=Deferrivibrio essentukiensis TaxID=2880922 RepID=UPI001F600A76|nr:DUF502 domain-containing protein [Deferrivibrio essentukiensis]MBZ4671946.1 hypothetical protein [Deferribacteraceae bacterium]MCB4204183.1 DUF502 domain-containing protein [Deferrivibrio essentukiensis]
MKKFRVYIRNVFLAGILTVLPVIVTYFFLSFIFKKLTGFLVPYLDLASDYFEFYLTEAQKALLSLSLLIIAIFFIGLFAKNYFGKQIIKFFEMILSKIPLIRGIYSATRQIIDTFQSPTGSNFKKVVLVEYPRRGIYSIGFVTKESSNFYNSKIGKKCSNVFIPTTPNPTSGFILIIPNEDLVELDLTVEEGVKFVISAGLLSPEKIREELSKNKEVEKNVP